MKGSGVKHWSHQFGRNFTETCGPPSIKVVWTLRETSGGWVLFLDSYSYTAMRIKKRIDQCRHYFYNSSTLKLFVLLYCDTVTSLSPVFCRTLIRHWVFFICIVIWKNLHLVYTISYQCYITWKCQYSLCLLSWVFRKHGFLD